MTMSYHFVAIEKEEHEPGEKACNSRANNAYCSEEGKMFHNLGCKGQTLVFGVFQPWK